jgi:cobalamin biosynthesis Co2+ chelatase CbiK
MTTRQKTKIKSEQIKVINGEEQRTFDEYEQKFTETNKKMKMTAGYLAYHASFGSILQKIESLTPEGVRMQKITTTDYKMLLAGTAETREYFLLFEENIKKDECFTSVNAPLSNLFSEKDVVFVIDLLVKSECLQGNMKVL